MLHRIISNVFPLNQCIFLLGLSCVMKLNQCNTGLVDSERSNSPHSFI